MSASRSIEGSLGMRSLGSTGVASAVDIEGRPIRAGDVLGTILRSPLETANRRRVVVAERDEDGRIGGATVHVGHGAVRREVATAWLRIATSNRSGSTSAPALHPARQTAAMAPRAAAWAYERCGTRRQATGG